MLDKDGYILLTVGAAKVLDEEEEKQDYSGEMDYMAPEVIGGKGFSYTADWWTLGILTYEMVVGFPPF